MDVELVALRDIGDGCGTIPAGAEFKAQEQLAREYVNEGRAAPRAGARLWSGPHWPGATVAILASGPSMCADDADLVRAWRDADPVAHRAIAVNTTYQLAPWADIIFACDGAWWKLYGSRVRAECPGQLWTQDRAVIGEERIRHIESRAAPGLSRKQGVIHQGMNSGYMAVGLAHQTGAARVLLLGFDMAGGHWHGDHPSPLPNPRAAIQKDWRNNFVALAKDLAAVGVDVVNCTRETALECFKRVGLEEALR